MWQQRQRLLRRAMTVIVPLWVSGLGLSFLTDGRSATAGRILMLVAMVLLLLALASGTWKYPRPMQRG